MEDLAFRDAVPEWPERLSPFQREHPKAHRAPVEPIFMKGNEAVVYGALLAGCRCFFGYPITPASEIAHTAAELFPRADGVFLQAESEIAAIQMVYGASSAGVRCMTASSSPGISLKQEGMSYAAGAELPMVVVDISRGGPGLGNIAPEQADYFQMVKGGGHGSYRMPVLAPNGAQEMCELTMLAFDLADNYRTPAVILADGLIGQMKEPVHLPEPVAILPQKPWSVSGTEATRPNLITSIYLDPQLLEQHIHQLQAKYRRIVERETRWEEYRIDDAEIVLVGYGVVSRVLHGVVERARAEGLRVGMIRPISLWPFPSEIIRHAAQHAHALLAVEMSTGQMVEDVRLAASDVAPIHFYGRVGGIIPSETEILQEVWRIAESHRHEEVPA